MVFKSPPTKPISCTQNSLLSQTYSKTCLPEIPFCNTPKKIPSSSLSQNSLSLFQKKENIFFTENYVGSLGFHSFFVLVRVSQRKQESKEPSSLFPRPSLSFSLPLYFLFFIFIYLYFSFYHQAVFFFHLPFQISLLSG